MGSPKNLSAKSSQWFTPPWLLDLEREVLGGEFDLDPASCADAQKLVRAERWHDGAERGDGLTAEWVAKRMHLNPPYSPKDGGPVDPWLARVPGASRAVGCIVLPATPKKFRPIWPCCAVVFLDRRVQFVETIEQAWMRWADEKSEAVIDAEGPRVLDKLTEAGRKAGLPEGLTVGPAPTGEHVVAYRGPNITRFREVFGKLGAIVPMGSVIHG